MSGIESVLRGGFEVLLRISHWLSKATVTMAKNSLLLLSTLALNTYASSPVSPLTDESLIGSAYLPAANSSFSAFDDARAKAKAWIDQAVATGESEYGAIDTQETSF